jgi:succinate dehydrogenase / fumarate reductase, cytochrome b subunit
MSPPYRPLSPHLQVYRPQFTSILSITHRITGLALSAGALLMVGQLLAGATGPEAFAEMREFLGSFIGLVLLVAWSAALFYHLANGVRHLLWDVGYGLDLPSASRSGQAVILATILLTILAWLIALIFWRS